MMLKDDLKPGDKITHRTWCNELPVTEVVSVGDSMILLRDSDGYEHGLHASLHFSLDDLLSNYWRVEAAPAKCECGNVATEDGKCEHCDAIAGEPPHTGHYSAIGGAWWCDTCNSPCCELV